MGIVTQIFMSSHQQSLLFPAKTPLSVYLSGDDYVGYDLSQIGGAGPPILADHEHFHLEFRQKKQECHFQGATTYFN